MNKKRRSEGLCAVANGLQAPDEGGQAVLVCRGWLHGSPQGAPQEYKVVARGFVLRA